jgi:hypothetical protein
LGIYNLWKENAIMKWPVVFTTSLLLAGVSAGIAGTAAPGIRPDDATERLARRYVDAMIEEGMEKRQAPAPGNSTFDQDTTAACTSKLMTLAPANISPSGMAVCYNIPMLDNSTGVFMADLRVYRVADPTGDFAGVQSQDVQASLSYTSATVSENAGTVARRDDGGYSLISWPSVRSENKIQKRVVTPVLVKSYSFVGKINADKLTPNMDT